MNCQMLECFLFFYFFICRLASCQFVEGNFFIVKLSKFSFWTYFVRFIVLTLDHLGDPVFLFICISSTLICCTKMKNALYEIICGILVLSLWHQNYLVDNNIILIFTTIRKINLSCNWGLAFGILNLNDSSSNPQCKCPVLGSSS